MGGGAQGGAGGANAPPPSFYVKKGPGLKQVCFSFFVQTAKKTRVLNFENRKS